MNNIKRARLESELAQKQVSLELGVSQATVSEWESGKSTPAPENLKRLATLFSCTIDYLLDHNPSPPNTKPPVIEDPEAFVRQALEIANGGSKKAGILFYNGEKLVTMDADPKFVDAVNRLASALRDEDDYEDPDKKKKRKKK